MFFTADYFNSIMGSYLLFWGEFGGQGSCWKSWSCFSNHTQVFQCSHKSVCQCGHFIPTTRHLFFFSFFFSKLVKSVLFFFLCIHFLFLACSALGLSTCDSLKYFQKQEKTNLHQYCKENNKEPNFKIIQRQITR